MSEFSTGQCLSGREREIMVVGTEEFWGRIRGLPLHAWVFSVFSEINIFNKSIGLSFGGKRQTAFHKTEFYRTVIL